MAGLARAATAVAATTKGSSNDRLWDGSPAAWSAPPPLPTRSSPGPAPNERREALPSLRCHPSLPSLGNDVEHADAQPHLQRPRTAFSVGKLDGGGALTANEGDGGARPAGVRRREGPAARQPQAKVGSAAMPRNRWADRPTESKNEVTVGF